MGSNSELTLAALVEGQTIAGKYVLGRQLGEGGMCVVYEAEHVGLRQGLALKVLKPELATDAGCVTRFEREARAAAQLRSPNVAKVFDVDYLPTGVPYITMELLVGNDLAGELSKAGRLSPELAVDYIRQACAGIAEAHSLGIVHRDLKPENLFLTELGELTNRKLLKILDFGIAKDIADSARRLTAPDAVFGTVDYMSPEQIRSASDVDHRTDLWSLGIILYELLTGRTPYHGDARSVIAQIVSDPIQPPSVLVPELAPSLVATVMKALHKDPASRFQSAEELREALVGFGEFEPITSVIARLPPQSVPRRTSRSVRISGGMSESHRDARTHASWETRTERRPWGKAWLVVPATGMLIGAAAAGLFYHRGQAHAVESRPPKVDEAPSSIGSRATAPAAPGEATAPTTPAPSAAASVEPAPSAEPPAEPAPTASSSSLAAAPKAKRPRPRLPSGSAPAPASSPATPRLPKHL